MIWQVYTEFANTRASFGRAVCVDPVLYRPPYGETSGDIHWLMSRMGNRGVLWSLDTNDWYLADYNPTQM